MAKDDEAAAAAFAGVTLVVCLPAEHLEGDDELADALRDAGAAGAVVVEGAALGAPPPAGATHVLTNALSHGVCAGLERGEGPAAVTIDWLYSSLEAGRLLPAWPHAAVEAALHRPAISEGGVPGAAQLKVAQTNFRGELRQELQTMVEMLGAVHTKDLKRDNTHLLCNTFEGAKYERGTQWGLSAVNHHWLEDCLWQWKILPAQPYMNLPGKAVAEAAEAKGGRLFQPPQACADHVEDSVMETAIDGTEAGVADSTGESEEVKTDGAVRRSDGAGVVKADAVALGAAAPTPAVSDETNDSGAEAGLDAGDARAGVVSPPTSSMRKLASSRPEVTPRATPAVSPGIVGDGAQPRAVGTGGEQSPRAGDLDAGVRAEEETEARAQMICRGEVEDPSSPPGKPESQAKRASLREVSQNAPDLSPICKSQGDVRTAELEGMIDAETKGGKATQEATKSAPTQAKGKAKAGKVKGKAASAFKADKSKKRKVEQRGGADVRLTLSGMHTEERNKYTAICGQLGIKLLCESRHDEGKYRYDKHVTHVVATSPLGRTAKLLYAMASGVWVLRTDWLDKCAATGKLVDEEPYEWSASRSAKGSVGTRVDLGAPRRWRKLRGSTGKRPLEGLSVCLIGAFEARVAALLRGIVSAGGATLKSGNWQDSDLAVFATRCVGEKGAVVGSPSLVASAEEMREAGVACVAQDFVLDWLAMPQSDLGVHVLLDSQRAAEDLLKRCLQPNGQTPQKAAKRPRPSDSF